MRPPRSIASDVKSIAGWTGETQLKNDLPIYDLHFIRDWKNAKSPSKCARAFQNGRGWTRATLAARTTSTLTGHEVCLLVEPALADRVNRGGHVVTFGHTVCSDDGSLRNGIRCVLLFPSPLDDRGHVIRNCDETAVATKVKQWAVCQMPFFGCVAGSAIAQIHWFDAGPSGSLLKTWIRETYETRSEAVAEVRRLSLNFYGYLSTRDEKPNNIQRLRKQRQAEAQKRLENIVGIGA